MSLLLVLLGLAIWSAGATVAAGFVCLALAWGIAVLLELMDRRARRGRSH